MTSHQSGELAPESITTSDAAATVARLRATFNSERTKDLQWRIRQLQGLDNLLREQADELAEAMMADLRRTKFEAVLFEVVSTRSEVRHALKRLPRWMRDRRVSAPWNARPGRAWYRYEPLGVTLIIGAWNYPIHLTLTPLVGALAAGNCVVVKPSEVTPASSAVLAQLIPHYLDPDAVAVVEGGAEVTQELIGCGLDHIFFTGSATVGKAVMTAAGRHLTPVTLELGGKCPAIVTASARPDATARRLAFGKLVNSGQTCVAPDYVLVDRRVREPFVRHLIESLRDFSEGRELPIVNSAHAQRIAGLLSGCGGQTLLGGEVDVHNAVAPATVVLDPDPGSDLLADEIFGPVLPVVTVDSLDEAIAHVRRGTRPLSTYLFTQEPGDEQRVLEQISTGATVINHVMMHLAVSDLPFGGVGTSGTGHYHGHWSFEAFSHPKAVLRKPSGMDVKFIYPPYSKIVQKLMQKLM